jgi:hypothetical protein
MNGKQRRNLKQKTRKALSPICELLNPKGMVKIKGDYSLFFDKNGGLWNILPKHEILNTYRGQMRSINLINKIQDQLNNEVF